LHIPFPKNCTVRATVDSLLAGMKRSPSDMLLQTPTQTVRTVERDLAAAKRAAAREAAGAEREIMALKGQVAA
jgi:hypothetical protein